MGSKNYYIPTLPFMLFYPTHQCTYSVSLITVVYCGVPMWTFGFSQMDGLYSIQGTIEQLGDEARYYRHL